jgi:pyridoxal 5'-phosphate synthase pdxT subunit
VAALVPIVGVLALQGDFAEHVSVFRQLGVSACEVRTADELRRTDALVIPGGESTSIAKLLDIYGLREAIVAYGASGRAVWGTCAGMILLARELIEDLPLPLGMMDMVVQRNAFGRQVQSFETDLDVAGLEGGPLHAVFIRAPRVCETGPNVQVLSRLEEGSAVAVRQDNLLATAFHPELTPDDRLHRYFLQMVDVAVRP